MKTFEFTTNLGVLCVFNSAINAIIACNGRKVMMFVDGEFVKFIN